jgi:hypothetical protein
MPPFVRALLAAAPRICSQAFSVRKFLALELQRAALVISFSSRRRR